MRLSFAAAAIALTVSLAACGNSSTPPASTPQASTPAATKPAATTTASADLQPMIGDWAAESVGCASPISIAANSFKGAENSCEITGWTDNKDGTYTAAMSCNSQGTAAKENVTMTPIFGPQGEGIRLAYNDRGGDPVTVFRCAKPKAQ